MSFAKAYDVEALGLETTGGSGNEVYVKCPYHDDNSQSAQFNVVKGLLYCFACGKVATAKEIKRDLGGDIIKVNKRILQRDREWDKEINWRLFPLATDNEYLKSRGVTNGQVVHYKILEVPNMGVAFPVSDLDGVVRGLQIRRYNGNPKYMFLGESAPMWPLSKVHFLNPNMPVLIVEGIFGVLNAERQGHQALALMGANKLNQFTKTLLKPYKAVGFFDDDKAGYLAAAKMLVTFNDPLTSVFVPGAEVDEMTENDWLHILDNHKEVYNVNDLSRMGYLKPYEVKRMIERFGK